MAEPQEHPDHQEGPGSPPRIYRLREYETPCPYLPGLMACNESYRFDVLPAEVYERLMHAGFRRSGLIVYRPRCSGCTACRPIRVPVDLFTESRSQRRVRRRNADLRVEVGPLTPTSEKFEIFARYLDSRHDDSMSRDIESFRSFLYTTATTTWEVCYFAGDRLIGVSIVDVCPTGLSSVYVYFDPAESPRSPGTFSALHEIDLCRRHGLPYYYLGYWVKGAVTMDYKERFRPNEILDEDNVWQVHRA